jgi:hypothetical protein
MKRKWTDPTPFFRRLSHFSVPIPLLAAVSILSVNYVVGQSVHKNGPTSSHLARKTHVIGKAKPAGLAGLAHEPPPVVQESPPPPPPPLTPGQMPPKVPQVSWDGKLLTINSDNSTLGDILAAIRRLTGADLDIPTKGSSERIAARLGPGPAREIISTLLSWTDFDYVIQASDTDAAGIRSVLLTPRGKSETTVASAGAPADTPARAMYRSYAQPRPTKSDETPAPENAAATQTEAAAEPPPPRSQPAPADSQLATAVAPPAPAEPSATTAAISPAAESPAAATVATTVSADPPASQADLTASAAISNSAAPAPLSESEQRIQDMQNLFQQRKQMIEDARKPPAN